MSADDLGTDVGAEADADQGARTTLPAHVDGVGLDPVDPPGTVDASLDVDDEDGLFPAPVVAAPQTGDPLIDSALDNLEGSASAGDLDEQIEAGERVHRTLRDRLADLGGE